MARPPLETAAPTRSVPLVLRHLRALGLDVDRLIRRLHLPFGAERREEVAMTPSGFEALLDLACAEAGDPLLTLRLPAAVMPATFQVGELAVRASPTVRAAFERAARYAPLFYAHLGYVCESTADELRMRHRARVGASGPQAARFALASLLVHARKLCVDSLVPSRVWFRGEAPQDPTEIEGLRGFFGTRSVVFGQDDAGLAFESAMVDRPSLTGDGRLLATMERWAERALAEVPAGSEVAAAARAALRELPAPASAAQVARRLGLSARTLQRRLAEEGTTLSCVSDEVRRDEITRLLRDTDLPVAEIAARTGFSDAATLTRAFRRWTGQPPGAWRRDLA